MRLILSILGVAVSTASLACWDAPTQACFEKMWQDEILAYVSEGNRIEKLDHITSGGLDSQDSVTARALLSDVTYQDIIDYYAPEVAEHNAKVQAEKVRERQKYEEEGLSEIEINLLQMFTTNSELPDIDPYFLAALYGIIENTGDIELMEEWYRHIPETTKVSYYISAPSPNVDTVGLPNEAFYSVASDVGLVYEALRKQDVIAARDVADKLIGEPKFMAWRRIAKQAIDNDDYHLLRDSISGMAFGFDRSRDMSMNEEEFELAEEAARIEYEMSGDPDELAYLYETADGSLYDLSDAAWTTIFLADAYLQAKTEQSVFTQEKFDDYIASAEVYDQSTLVTNAIYAKNLGLDEISKQLFEKSLEDEYASYDFLPYALPDTAEAWAIEWLEFSENEIRKIFSTLENGEIKEIPPQVSEFLHEDALDQILEISEKYLEYGMLDQARDIVDFARESFAKHQARMTLPLDFDSYFSVLLKKVDDVDAIIVATGKPQGEVDREYIKAELLKTQFANIDASELQAKTLAEMVFELDAKYQNEFVSEIERLFAEENARLVEEGYPTLVNANRSDAAIIFARLGEWELSKREFEHIATVDEEHERHIDWYERATTLKGLFELFSSNGEEFSYPYEQLGLLDY